jgi:ABC-2 type transport system ATP-binding protein
VRSAHLDDLLARLRDHGLTATHAGGQELRVDAGSAQQVGALAHAWGIPLDHLAEAEVSLEDAYLRLTAGSIEHHGPTDADRREVPA